MSSELDKLVGEALERLANNELLDVTPASWDGVSPIPTNDTRIDPPSLTYDGMWGYEVNKPPLVCEDGETRYCRFCSSPAVASYWMDRGCYCYPEDRIQDLCFQHIVNARPLGSMDVLQIFSQEMLDWLDKTWGCGGMADAADLKSVIERYGGSTPPTPTDVDS